MSAVQAALAGGEAPPPAACLDPSKDGPTPFKQQQLQQQQQQPQQTACEEAFTSSSSTAVAAPRMRRASSAPAFRAPCFASGPPPPRGCGCGARGGAACDCLEVFVVTRAFTEFAGGLFTRLTPAARLHLVDLGICHYMTVFRTPDGKLHQFDFGPRGGDVEKVNGPLAGLLRTARQQQQPAPAPAPALASITSGSGGGRSERSSGSSSGGSLRACPSAPALDQLVEASAQPQAVSAQQQPQRPNGGRGEIREEELDALPQAHLYVGRTALSLEDVRRFNHGRAKSYRLHENDCRHYVNQLVQHATGVEHSTQHMKRHHFRSRFQGRTAPWHGWFVEAGQFATDVGNWGRLQAGSAAALLALTGRMTIAHLKAFAAIAHAKSASAGLFFGPPLLPVPLQLPPVLQMLRSAQIHISSALAAAAGAPGGAASATAVAGAGGGAASGAASAVSSTFGGFGLYASGLQLPSILMAPSAVVAATVRRPLTGGAVAAAGAVALGGATGPDGVESGRRFALTLSSTGRGAVARVRDQVERGLTGAALTLRRISGGGGGWGSSTASPSVVVGNRRLAIVAGATAAREAASSAAGSSGGAGGANWMRGFAWIGGSAARLSGAIAAAARQSIGWGTRGAGGGGAVSAGAVSIAALGEQSAASVGGLQALFRGVSNTAVSGSSVAGGPVTGDALAAAHLCNSKCSANGGSGAAVTVIVDARGCGGGGCVTELPRARTATGATAPLSIALAVRKSSSCGSLSGGGAPPPLEPAAPGGAAGLGGGSSRGAETGSIQYGGCSGRQTLHLPAPRLSWLRRGSGGTLVLHSTA